MPRTFGPNNRELWVNATAERRSTRATQTILSPIGSSSSDYRGRELYDSAARWRHDRGWLQRRYDSVCLLCRRSGVQPVPQHAAHGLGHDPARGGPQHTV